MSTIPNERTSGNRAIAPWFHIQHLRRAVHECERLGIREHVTTMGKRTQLALLTTNEVLVIAPLLVSSTDAFMNATNEQMELGYSPCCDENGFVDVGGDEAGTAKRVFGASTRSSSRCRAKSSRASSRTWSCSCVGF